MMAVNATAQYDHFRNFAYSRLAVVIAFLWGFSEATFFFIIPDVFFMLTALFVPQRGFLHVFVTVAGALAGGSLMYFLACQHPQQMIQFLAGIPLVSQKLITSVHEKLIQEGGLDSIFWAPFQGIPYKIYAVQSAVLKFDYFQFMLTSIPARLVRMLILTAVISLIAGYWGDHIKKNTKAWIIGYGIFWVIFYFVYAAKIISTYY